MCYSEIWFHSNIHREGVFPFYCMSQLFSEYDIKYDVRIHVRAYKCVSVHVTVTLVGHSLIWGIDLTMRNYSLVC